MIAGLHRLRERFDAILLDLDGTLLDGSSRLTPRAIAAVHAMQEAGFVVLICTGRSMVGARAVWEEIGLETACVAFNGAWIGRPGEAPWRYATLPDALLPTLAGVESQAAFSFRHEGDRKVALWRPHPLLDRVITWYTGGEAVRDPSALPDADLLRISLFVTSRAATNEAWSALPPEVHAEIQREVFTMSLFPEFRESDLWLCELQRRANGKAEVFPYLEQAHGIEASRVIAVGDHVNDRSMLAGAGLGVGMGNGVPDLLQHADLVVGRNDEDGLALWIEHGAPLVYDAERVRARERRVS